MNVDDIIDVHTHAIFGPSISSTTYQEVQKGLLNLGKMENYIEFVHSQLEDLEDKSCYKKEDTQSSITTLTGLWMIVGGVYISAMVLRFLPFSLFKPINMAGQLNIREKELSEKYTARSDKLIGFFSNMLQKNYVAFEESIMLLELAYEYKKKMEDSLESKYNLFKNEIIKKRPDFQNI